MSTQPTQAIAPTYTCRLCRRTLQLPGTQIIGEKPEERGARVAKLLAEHLGEAHREDMGGLMLGANAFLGWMVTSQFDHTDLIMGQQSEEARKSIRRTSRPRHINITDEIIERQVDAHLKLEGDQRAATILLLKTMRDSLEEKDPVPQT